MKVGVIGAGGVGAACVTALALRNCAREIVVIDLNNARAKGVATDVRYGANLTSVVDIYAGDYADLKNADLVMITAGVNEKAGGATNRSDPKGRLHLLSTNAKIYQDIVPQVVKVGPNATILVVADPPDPLADIARIAAGHSRVVSTGTFLDSKRFCWHLANYLKINPASVNAQVLGEHGTSSVFLWSTASVCGVSILEIFKQRGEDLQKIQQDIEQQVRFANITIIEGINASQYGIGMVCAEITEIILRDEKSLVPIGSYHKDYGVTFTMPSILGREGVIATMTPTITAEEKAKLQHSADVLKEALKQIE